MKVLIDENLPRKLAGHLKGHECPVHIGESGAAEPDDDYFYRSRRNRYRNYQDGDEEDDDEDDEDDEEDASFSVATVDDTWQYVDEWRDTNDHVVEFGRIPLARGELLPQGALDGEPPDEKRLTEASGNEGATYERSYHRAALVLWRQNRTVDVLLQAGVVAALPYLKQLAAGGKRAQPEAIAVAERILGAWPGDAQRWDSYSVGREWPGPANRIEMIAALTKLNAPDLLDRFLRASSRPLTRAWKTRRCLPQWTCSETCGAPCFLPLWCRSGWRSDRTSVQNFCWRSARILRPVLLKLRRPPLPHSIASSHTTQNCKPSIGNRKSGYGRSAPGSSKICSARYRISRVGFCAAPPPRRSPRAPKLSVPRRWSFPRSNGSVPGAGRRQRHLTAVFGICGRARRSSCSGAARFLRSPHRTGVRM